MKKHYQLTDHVIVPCDIDKCQIVVYQQPSPEERRLLIDELAKDDHILTSALDPDELARIEFDDYISIIYKQPHSQSPDEPLVFRVSSVGLFLFKDKLRIVCGEELPVMEGRWKVESLTGIVLKLLSRAVVHFREHLRAINRVSDELQGEINRSMENKHLIAMFALEKSLVYYTLALHSNGSLLEKLKFNAKKIGFSEDDMDTLEDLSIDNNQCSRQAETTSNILASLMDARASIVANNINVLMKRLNVITIAIMVPTLVVSAFSMNVGLPFQNREWMFYAVHGIAVLSAGAFLYFWKRWAG